MSPCDKEDDIKANKGGGNVIMITDQKHSTVEARLLILEIYFFEYAELVLVCQMVLLLIKHLVLLEYVEKFTRRLKVDS